MQRLEIAHTTTYRYATPVQLGTHRLLIRPREGHDVRIDSSTLDITPAHTIKWHRDVYDNSVGVVSFVEPASALHIESTVRIEHYENAPLDFIVAGHAVNFPFQYGPEERIDLLPYQMPVFAWEDGAVGAWVSRFWIPGQVQETYVLLDAMNRAIPAQLGYVMREEPGVQSPAETLRLAQGSCRDFAAFFIEACRYLGLAARFVSGYLHTPADAPVHGSTHAWSEVYLPGAGWKGFDSTTGELTGSHHIAVAVSRHPASVPPVSGTYRGDPGAPPSLEVDVVVRTPR